MSAYLPSLHALSGAAGLAVVLMLFIGLGAFATARRSLPEVQLLAGWGIACVVLTVWGVLTSASLAIPALGLGGVGLFGLLRLRSSLSASQMRGAQKLLLLSVPLWLVVLPLRPSQIDTWLNLLPNAGYLFTHAMLPMADRPPSWSFLPVALELR